MFVIISKKRLRALQLEASEARYSALKWQRTAEADQKQLDAHRNALRASDARIKTAMHALPFKRRIPCQHIWEPFIAGGGGGQNCVTHYKCSRCAVIKTETGHAK